MGLVKKLEERRKNVSSCLCIGIDPDEEDIQNFMDKEKGNNFENIKNNLNEEAINIIEHEKDILLNDFTMLKEDDAFFYFFNHFCLYIINTTKIYALAYKMNFAFYLPHGCVGIKTLKNIFVYLKHMNIPTILDIKVNDIGSTIKKYREFVFDYLESDCCTVNIYMGTDILNHICYDEIKQKRHSVYVLIKTTNPGSYLFQNQLSFENKKAYLLMAEEAEKMADDLQMKKNDEFIGFVIGANCYKEMAVIRKNFPKSYILSPGVGAQHADLLKTLLIGFSKNMEKLLINVGRAIAKSENPGESAHSFYKKIKDIADSL